MLTSKNKVTIKLKTNSSPLLRNTQINALMSKPDANGTYIKVRV